MRNLRWGDYFRLSGWTLNAPTAILMRERQREITKIEDGAQCDHRHRERDDEATRQGMPAATRRWKQQGMDSL